MATVGCTRGATQFLRAVIIRSPLMRTLAREGMTMLVVTHEMGFAREVADRVCFLHGGLIIEEGSAQQVLCSPREPRTREFLRHVLTNRMETTDDSAGANNDGHAHGATA